MQPVSTRVLTSPYVDVIQVRGLNDMINIDFKQSQISCSEWREVVRITV